MPGAPVRPRTFWNLGLSIIAGLALGIIVAVAVEFLDSTLRTPDDVEQRLGLAVIAIVPKFVAKH